VDLNFLGIPPISAKGAEMDGARRILAHYAVFLFELAK
jgi:hypothetical protein